MISPSTFRRIIPHRSYGRFVASAMLRILLGYIFLVNAFLILMKATAVLEIFYDVLALQFISELDNIAFGLAKLDVLGTRMRCACTARLFQTELERKCFTHSMKSGMFLKSIYLVNLVIFLAPMITISNLQNEGHFHCYGIEVDFGDAVWDNALILWPSGEYSERMLAYSSFNGVYEKNGTEHGRPRYQERRKFDHAEFDTARVIPAEIKYSQDLSAWIFTHPLIVKKKYKNEMGSWLLRSPETTDMNLLNVDGNWQIWHGVIGTSHVSYTCMKCSDNTDCNLNGVCLANGECDCDDEEEDTMFLGPHCEVELKDRCRSIVDETVRSTWSVLYYKLPGDPKDSIIQQYNRPIYQHSLGIPNVTKDDIGWLMYTGSRWITYWFKFSEEAVTFEQLLATAQNFHAFWYAVFSYNPTEKPIFISDPTTGVNPVGVDWYRVTEMGDQFGPFGALHLVSKEAGRGSFDCAGNYTPVEIVNGALNPEEFEVGLNGTEVEDVTNATDRDV